MYEYLNGLITEVTPSAVVIDVNGVGYRLLVANPFHFHADEKTPQKIYVYQVVRENELTLYGFADAAAKQLFIKLLNVSGIGPKSALAILASDDQSGLVAAISANDTSYLTKFPGVGKKTASQMVLDLKGKLAELGDVKALAGQQDLALSTPDNTALSESLAALKALGYKQTEIKKIKPQLEKLPPQSTDDYLRAALKLIMN